MATVCARSNPVERTPSRTRPLASVSGICDEQLLLQYAETGQRETFEELVRRYERGLNRYLYRLLGDRGLVEDAIQTTFLQLHLKCRLFDSRRKLRPWLYRIAKHQAIDLLRRNERHRMVSLNTTQHKDGSGDEGRPLQDFLEARNGESGEAAYSSEDCQRVRAAVERLPGRLKPAVVLAMYQGLAYREVAEALQIPVGTVKSRIHAGVQRVHRSLAIEAARSRLSV